MGPTNFMMVVTSSKIFHWQNLQFPIGGPKWEDHIAIFWQWHAQMAYHRDALKPGGLNISEIAQQYSLFSISGPQRYKNISTTEIARQ